MINDTNRRKFVKAAAASGVIGLAGCLGSTSSDSGNQSSSGGGNQSSEANEGETNQNASSENNSGSSNGSTEQISMEIASAFEPSHIISVAGKLFKEEIEQSTNGSFSVTITAGGSYGDEDEISELVRDGGVEAHTAGPLPFFQFAPDYSFFGNPFVMDDFDHIKRVMDSDLMSEGIQKFQNQGNQLPVGSPFYRGIRQYVSNFPVRTPEDVNGVDMRITELEDRVKIWSQIGVNSVPVAWSEVYTALQTGTVETMAAPPGALTSINISEIRNHLSMTNHNIESGFIYVGTDFYNSLSDEMKKAVQEAAIQATEEASKRARNKEQEHIQTLVDNGITKVPADDVDRNAFQEAARPAITELFKNKWAGSWEEVKSI